MIQDLSAQEDMRKSRTKSCGLHRDLFTVIDLSLSETGQDDGGERPKL